MGIKTYCGGSLMLKSSCYSEGLLADVIQKRFGVEPETLYNRLEETDILPESTLVIEMRLEQHTTSISFDFRQPWEYKKRLKLDITIDHEEKTAYFNNFESGQNNTNVDGARLLRFLKEQNDLLNLNALTFTAARTGKYVWALLGGVPDNWGSLKKYLDAAFEGILDGTKRVDRIKPGKITEEEKEEIRALLASDDPKALWGIADHRLGKPLLRNLPECALWKGHIDLADEEAVTRLDRYLDIAAPSPHRSSPDTSPRR